MKRGLAWVALGLAAAACSTTQLQRDAGQLPVDATFADGAIPPGGFVTGDLEGSTVRTDRQAVAYWFSGIQQGFLGVEAHDDQWQWVLVIRNAVGSWKCPSDGYIVLQPLDSPTAGRATYWAGGSCAFEITRAADVGGMFEGTFTATIVRTGGGMPATVTKGAFHVPRIADTP